MINVTKPFLPPKEEFLAYVDGIWDRNWLTNNGPLVNELELKLKEYLSVDHLLYLSNGTIALQIAIKAMGIQGEIITTPFSYVATTASIVWENCVPVFVDIDPDSLNIDPVKIESAITDRTTAILATHVYGNPCNIAAIDAIAQKYGLKVIYDGAHCFGTTYKNKSVFEYGDITTLSFHSTKLFHTIEGGAIVTKDPELAKIISYSRNFGHAGIEDFYGLGINAKNSEFHAAMGLCNLKYVNAILAKRKALSYYYDEKLKLLNIQRIAVHHDSNWNYSYYPILFKDENTLLKAIETLHGHWIYPRRYFYPLLNGLNYVLKTETPVAEDVSRRVACLPMYHSLTFEEIDMIARVLLRAQNYA